MDNKLTTIEAFANELNPVMEQLNEVLAKYGLNKEVISFSGWEDGKIVPFISYVAFPVQQPQAIQDKPVTE